MPIFEYDCFDCDKPFEKFVRSINTPIEKVACPTCGGTRVLKKLSAFASKSGGNAGSSSGSSSGDCSTGGT
jgi:putative FmdB family regulatory protein